MQIVIEIPQGLKIDFEYENWTALTCAEMKNALMNGTVLPKHGRLGDLDKIIKTIDREYPNCDRQDIKQWIENADTILEAWGNEE